MGIKAMHTFNRIITKWPSYQSLADDLGQPVDTVRKWNKRNSIPAGVWMDLVSVASRRGFDVTLEDLCLALKVPV